jgi:hypothetical protein
MTPRHLTAFTERNSVGTSPAQRSARRRKVSLDKVVSPGRHAGWATRKKQRKGKRNES